MDKFAELIREAMTSPEQENEVSVKNMTVTL